MSGITWPHGQIRSERAVLWLCIAAVLACAPPAGAAFVFTTLDHPLAGRGGTTANDVSGSRIVGSYLDAANVRHGFVYDGVNWTTLDHPGAGPSTNATGVWNGLICGTYVTPSGRTLGFLYDGSNWATIERPPLGPGPADTFVRGISGDTLVGYSIESFVARGFLYRAGEFSDVLVAGAAGTFPDDLDSGRIVGTYEDLLGSHGFIADGDVARTIDHPLGMPLGTALTGVDGDRVVGNYLALPDGASHGFLYDGRTFEPIDVPGAADTTVNGIDGDRIVGSYRDAAGDTYGFVAVVPEPTAAAALLVFLGWWGSRQPRRRAAA